MGHAEKLDLLCFLYPGEDGFGNLQFELEINHKTKQDRFWNFYISLKMTYSQHNKTNWQQQGQQIARIEGHQKGTDKNESKVQCRVSDC